MEITPIAYIRTDFKEKFGIPRQAGLVPELEGTIFFEPQYREAAALRGLEGFDYIWLLWQFEGTDRENPSLTVKPPRLGGDVKMGVFATRSPFRPNPIGLSCVALEKIEYTQEGPVLHVKGADLRDHTPIFDIKPYVPYADCHPDAAGGFAAAVEKKQLQVSFPEDLLNEIPQSKRQALLKVLAQDPRPASQHDTDKEFGIAFAGYNVRFFAKEEKLFVTGVERVAKE